MHVVASEVSGTSELGDSSLDPVFLSSGVRSFSSVVKDEVLGRRQNRPLCCSFSGRPFCLCSFLVLSSFFLVRLLPLSGYAPFGALDLFSWRWPHIAAHS